MTTTFIPATKADLDDQAWLDRQVSALRDGIEAARDIWLNWSDGRNVSRFAEGESYGDFIKSRLGYALPLADVLKIMPGASTREIGKVAGVSNQTVGRAKKAGAPDGAPDNGGAKVIGADGKSYPATVVASPGSTSTIVAPLPATVVNPGRRGRKAPPAAPLPKHSRGEVRDQIATLKVALATLRPGNLTPGSHQQVVDLLPTVEAWLADWKAVKS